MPLSWINEFLTARAQGAYAFLFNGSVNDGFPVNEASLENLQDLHPWQEAIMRALPPHDGERLVWRFDAASGFAFNDPGHRESFTRRLLGNQPTPSAGDPIAAARQALGAPARQLPQDPFQALCAMRTVMESGSSQNPPACTAILPDIDTYFGNPTTAAQIALAIQQLCEVDAFARAGHLVLMSVGALGSLPERLRKTGGCVRLIDVAPPSQEEREAYLERVCQPEDLAQRLGELDALIAQEIEKLKAEAVSEQRARRAGLQELREGTSEQLKLDHEHRRLLQERERLQQELLEISQRLTAQSTATRQALEQERDTLQASVAPGGEHAVRTLTPEAWNALKVGDVIGFTEGDSILYQYVLRAPDHLGDAHLSKIGQRDQLSVSDTGEPALYTWRKGALLVRKNSRMSRVRLWSASGSKIAQIIPAENHWVLKRISAITAELEAMDRDDPWQVVQARARLTEAEQLVAQRAGELTRAQEETCRGIEQAIAVLERLLQVPHSDELTRLQDERAQLTQTSDEIVDDQLFDAPPMGIPELARLCANLGFRDMRTILRRARANGVPLDATDVTSERAHLLRTAYGHLLEIIVPPYGFESVADLEGAKGYFLMVSARMRAGDWTRVPMGCTLVGPPGTGKTALVTALAREAGLLVLKPLHTQERWVGASEHNVAELHRALRHLAPCIVFRDEIDQEDGGRDGYSGDSGVSNRTRQAWLSFLSDPEIRGKVFVVSASNRPDLIDPAMLRSQRSDDVIAVLMPSAQTRERLFAVMIARYGFKTDVEDFAPFAKRTARLSGADIEAMVQRAERHSNGVITADDLTWAIEDFVAQHQQREIARMTLLAVQNVRSRALLPDNVAEEVAWARSVLGSQDPSTRALSAFATATQKVTT